MGLLSWLRGGGAVAGGGRPAASAAGSEVGAFGGLDDPRLAEFLRIGGALTEAGVTVDVRKALKNTALFRAVSLIAYSIGMLPLQLIEDESKAKATWHPLYRLLHRRPNGWQTAFDFRALMQLRVLVHGNAYALIVRAPDIRRGGQREPVQLVPLDPDRVRPEQRDDWSVIYRYQPAKGGERIYPAADIFHLRGLSMDGLMGLSVVRQAAEAIGLALAADIAAANLYKHGAFVGGALQHPTALSDAAFARLRESLDDKSGARNAGKSMILEEGMTWAPISPTARDAQLIEVRRMQVEEIARATGVVRPLLMLDETSWGSGVAELARFFVQFTLQPYFEAWQQAVERDLLSETDADRISAKFNAGALLRGSIKDQGEFFAKALGSGGQPGFYTPNEVREILDTPPHPDGDRLPLGSSAAAAGDAAAGDGAPAEESQSAKKKGQSDEQQ